MAPLCHPMVCVLILKLSICYFGYLKPDKNIFEQKMVNCPAKTLLATNFHPTGMIVLASEKQAYDKIHLPLYKKEHCTPIR